MLVGHEFLAFAAAGWVALRLGYPDRTALHAGLIAGLAGLLPDLDVAYATATYAVAVAGGTPLGWDPFWGVANATHRVVTHTLPTGVVAAVAFGTAVAAARRHRPANAVPTRPSPRVVTATIGVAAVVGAVTLVSGFRSAVSPAAAVVAAGFLACVVVAGWAVGGRADVSVAAATAASGGGFLSHPFGDVFLASPPPLLSPFGPPVLARRVTLAADPTLHLLWVLFAELAAVWLGLAVLTRLAAGRIGTGRLRGAIDPRAGVGVGYAPAAVVLPRPTIADAHVLGATIVPFAAIIGAWAGYASSRRGGRVGDAPAGGQRLGAVYAGVVAGVTALTLAAAAYTAVYTLV